MRIAGLRDVNGEWVNINPDHVRRIRPSGTGSQIEFDADHLVTVIEATTVVVE